MDKEEKAKNAKEFEKALILLDKAKEFAMLNMTLRDNISFIISRQALCTYKSKKPTEQEALINAKKILDELNPSNSHDVEVLGISGAINKRLFELTNDMNFLDNAIQFYEKGFQFKQDYYNGINAAFMNYKKASLLKANGNDWDDIKLKADYIRNSTLEIATKLESDSKFKDMKDAIWVLLTIAEVYNYRKNETKMKEYEVKANVLAERTNDTFAMSSYQEQKDKMYAWLVEARELAMDEGSSDAKHAVFGKYKGRINNYLSAAGYDMKKEGEDWAKRIQAAKEAKQNSN